MPAYVLSNKLRVASLYNLGFEFTPSLALTAKNFDTLELDIRSFREPLKRSIQGVISLSIEANFLAGGRPQQWVPLSDATIPVKSNDTRTAFPVEDPLLRSGLLMKTMAQLNIWTIGTVEASIQSLPDKIWYGNVHQAGTGSSQTVAASGKSLRQIVAEAIAGSGGSGERGKNIPARPFAMVQTEDLDKIVGVFEIWLNERIVARLGLLCLDLILTAQKPLLTTSTRCC